MAALVSALFYPSEARSKPSEGRSKASEARSEPGTGGCRFEPGAARADWLTPWSDAFPELVLDVAHGRPLVALVTVPLCSNDQIDCGSGPAGRAADLRTNLYWGAAFGVARFFDRPKSGWAPVEVSAPGGAVLEERIYRRTVSSGRWQPSFERLVGSACPTPPEEVEQLVVFRAVNGDHIDDAVRDFWRASTEGAVVDVPARGDLRRSLPVHVTGYAGHNRLLDGYELPALPIQGDEHSATPASFVLACYSEDSFSSSLRAAGSTPLVTTRALMAPEGYVVDAVLRALGDNATRPMLRKRVVRAYAQWQQIPEQTASSLFAR